MEILSSKYSSLEETAFNEMFQNWKSIFKEILPSFTHPYIENSPLFARTHKGLTCCTRNTIYAPSANKVSNNKESAFVLLSDCSCYLPIACLQEHKFYNSSKTQKGNHIWSWKIEKIFFNLIMCTS